MGKRKRRGKKPLELPDDFIIDILSRVPEKDLVRFTCVSKSWRSLINTTDLYLSELRSHRTALLGRPFLIIKKSQTVSGGKLYYNYWLELDSIEDGNPNPRLLYNPFDDNDNFSFPRWDAIVIGSCDGLVVLQQRSSCKIVVSNPATKKHHAVPPNPAGDDNVVFSGFGYDHVHGCYKLVTKMKQASRDDHIELMIYNANNCTWKRSRFEGLDEDCSSELMRCSGQSVEGALYWCVQTNSNEFKKIVCFVLAEEEFRVVDPPHFDGVRFNSDVTVFDGRLCLWCNPCDDEFEFWLMECDYKRQLGSPYSWRWIKFLSISGPDRTLPYIFGCPNLVPISFSACENKILFNVDYTQLFWYDIGEDRFDELKNCINEFNIDLSVEVTSCVPSLVGIGTS